MLPLDQKNMSKITHLDGKINQIYNLLDIRQDIPILSKDIVNKYIDETLIKLLCIENKVMRLSQKIIQKSTIDQLKAKISSLYSHIVILQNDLQNQ